MGSRFHINRSFLYPSTYSRLKRRKLGNNTYATYVPEYDRIDITLHGNRIASVAGITGPVPKQNGIDGGEYRIAELTDAGWNTVTTRNRLNGILDWLGIPGYFSQKNFRAMFNGEPLIPERSYYYGSTHKVGFVMVNSTDDWERVF